MEDDPDAVECMLSYLYTLEYSDGVNRDTQDDGTSQREEPLGSHTGNGTAEIPDLTEADRETGGSLDQQELGLLANMRVYALADKYEIHELKEFAKSRFSKQVWDNWSGVEFLEILGEVFDSAPSSDPGLRDVVTQVCLKNMKSLIVDERFRSIIADIPFLGTNLLHRASEAAEATIAGLQEELANAREEIEGMREDRDRAHELLERALDVIDQVRGFALDSNN
jgi:hypothetical protein